MTATRISGKITKAAKIHGTREGAVARARECIARYGLAEGQQFVVGLLWHSPRRASWGFVCQPVAEDLRYPDGTLHQAVEVVRAYPAGARRQRR